MAVLVICCAGCLLFVVSTAALGIVLRRSPSRERAERASRVMHGLFFLGLTWPPAVAYVYPGAKQVDVMFGFSPIPGGLLTTIAGVLLALIGLYFFVASNRALRARGLGANAFRLTLRVVEGDVYRRTRNPMSLGFYLLLVALGLIPRSVTFTLWALAAIIPAHLFFLLFFEERELELRLGESYRAYKRATPFLVPRV